MRKLGIAALASTFALASCATSPKNVSAQYVSPIAYQAYDCSQISMEMQRIGARVSEVTGQQQRAANNDALAMGVGLVIFWPALFFLASDNNKKEELSRLKGEYEALQQTATMKHCFANAGSAAQGAAPQIAPATHTSGSGQPVVQEVAPSSASAPSAPSPQLTPANPAPAAAPATP